MSYAFEVRGIEKSFGTNQVLKDVGFRVKQGEIYSLMGANGAGKSTLIRVLCGAHSADAGEIRVNGEVVNVTDPLSAQKLGIGTVHQNPNDGVVLDMTVAENLALDRFTDPSEGLWHSTKRTEEKAKHIAALLGMRLSQEYLRTPVREIGVSERQLLVLARTLSREPKILILDEPTSALSTEEIRVLFFMLRELVANGMSVLFVTHKLGEIDEMATRLGVLRDGSMRGEFERTTETGFDWSQVLTALFDKSLDEMRHNEVQGSRTLLEIRGAQVFEDSAPFSIDVKAGEVTALLGLLGSGKSELLEWIYGDNQLEAGELVIDGKPFAPKHPAEAIKRGVYLVPESRHEQAIVPTWSIKHLMTFPFLKAFSSFGVMKQHKEHTSAAEMIKRINIVTKSPNAAIETLSGGNQQKVAIGRWLLGKLKLLLLDEPFRGVDINARHDIAETVRELGDDAAVLVATSDIDEAFEVADRILVFKEGRVVADLRLTEATRENIVTAMSTHTKPMEGQLR